MDLGRLSCVQLKKEAKLNHYMMSRGEPLVCDPVRHVHMWVRFNVDSGVSSHLLKTEARLKEECVIFLINEEVIGR